MAICDFGFGDLVLISETVVLLLPFVLPFLLTWRTPMPQHSIRGVLLVRVYSLTSCLAKSISTLIYL